jgi:hypothetical protein
MSGIVKFSDTIYNAIQDKEVIRGGNINILHFMLARYGYMCSDSTAKAKSIKKVKSKAIPVTGLWRPTGL